MKWVRFQHNGGQPQMGKLAGDSKSIVRMGEDLDPLEMISRNGNVDPLGEAPILLDSVRLLAPIGNPEKVICVGKNYADHAREMGGEPPEIPVIFNKFPSAINDPGGDIELPGISSKVDFEAELVVVIGKPGKNIEIANARNHVFGYCCGNDISARDWQKEKPGGQWLLGKTFDGFAPIGPYLVTKDELDGGELDVQLRLNSEVMQSSNTRHFIFSIDFLISHLSQFCQLKTGDLIFTGTPAGVGAGRTPPLFLQAGDELEVEIQGLGKLKNRIVGPSASETSSAIAANLDQQ